jgi:uncharacterized protein YhbP (UPF0306 family)
VTDTDRQQALQYLQTHQVMTLATLGKDGVWATAVFYTNAAFDFYFLSAGHTRHAQNFTHQPHIAATIQEDYLDWPTIQGIQLEGNVQQLTGAGQLKAIAKYTKKFPFLANATPQIAAALTKVNWYRLTPTRLYFIDNTKGLGHRVEITLTQR